MAVGVSIGTTLVSKLGTRGHHNRIYIDGAVDEAARYQEGSSGSEIAVLKSVHQHLGATIPPSLWQDTVTWHPAGLENL